MHDKNRPRDQYKVIHVVQLCHSYFLFSHPVSPRAGIGVCVDWPLQGEFRWLP